MEQKEPPTPTSLPLSTFLLHRDRYKIDHTYQREAGTWGKIDEQYFIDTILRGLGVPPIFIHKKGGEQFIVDGQQRLNTIWKFKDDNLELSDKYSSDIINHPQNKEKNKGKVALKYSQLHKDWQDRCDSYPLPIIYLENYNDEEIRDLFRRLQRGKPLIPGEILNAYPGDIVLTMRKLAEHRFFTKIVAIKPKRYKHYHTAAQFMLLENEGIKDITPRYIYNFFVNNRNLSLSSNIYFKVNKVLNYLVDSFQTKMPETRKSGWTITIYLLVSHLLENYAIDNQKGNLKEFIKEFYQAVVSAHSASDRELMDFNRYITQGTNNQLQIKSRYDIILKRFLDKYNPVRLDENRLFTDDQKITIFRRDQEKCQVCGKKLTFDDSDTQFHHKDKYIEGGRTETDKGLLVCRDCHLNKIHGVRGK